MIKEMIKKPLYTFEVALVNYYTFDDKKSIDSTKQCAEKLGFSKTRKTKLDTEPIDSGTTSVRRMHFCKNNDGEYASFPYVFNVHYKLVNNDDFETTIKKVFFEINQIFNYFNKNGVVESL